MSNEKHNIVLGVLHNGSFYNNIELKTKLEARKDKIYVDLKSGKCYAFLKEYVRLELLDAPGPNWKKRLF